LERTEGTTNVKGNERESGIALSRSPQS